MFTILRIWFPLALITTLLCAFTFVAVHQSIRLEANELPIQLAEDASALLAKGTGAASVIGAFSTDVWQSLSPFLIIFDGSGALVASSATLNGQTPIPPLALLQAAQLNGEARVTWEPSPGVRLATVAKTFSGERSGVVIAGKPLREAEARILWIAYITLGAWGGSLFLTLLAACMWPRPRVRHSEGRKH